MKKIIAAAIAVLMLFTACSKNEAPANVQKNSIKNESAEITDEVSSEKEAIIGEEAPAENQKIKLPLDCDYLLFDTKGKQIYSGAVLEFENCEVMYSIDGSVYAYSLESGNELWSKAVEKQENFEFMYKTDEKNGYDFCLSFHDGIYYLNSEDPNAFYFEELPKEIAEDISSLNYLNRYSTSEKYFVWVNPDGVKLMNRENGETKTVLLNSMIAEQVVSCSKQAEERYQIPSGEEPYSYFEPHFICGGRKIAVQVYDSQYIYFSFVIYDIESEAIEYCISYSEMYSPNYPVEDRYAVLKTALNQYFIDAETTEVFEYPSESYDRVIKSKNIAFKYNTQTMDCFNLEIYQGEDFANAAKLLSVTEDKIPVRIEAAGENYVILCFSLDDGTYYCAVKLK